MILFKAMHFKDDEKEFIINKREPVGINWLIMLKNAISHMSHGNKKKNNDGWISATKDLSEAMKYLNKCSKFNGIAVIELNDVQKTGEIYDQSLENRGFLEDKINTNNDGVIATLDMSDISTIHYILTYLWLKEEEESIKNAAAFSYGYTAKEMLIMINKNLKVKFYYRRDIHKLKEKYYIYNNKNIISNYTEVYCKLLSAKFEKNNEASIQKKLNILFRNAFYDSNNVNFTKFDELNFDDFMYAYIYSLCLLSLSAKKTNYTKAIEEIASCLYKKINKIYDYKYIERDIFLEEFNANYRNSLGVLKDSGNFNHRKEWHELCEKRKGVYGYINKIIKKTNSTEEKANLIESRNFECAIYQNNYINARYNKDFDLDIDLLGDIL